MGKGVLGIKRKAPSTKEVDPEYLKPDAPADAPDGGHRKKQFSDMCIKWYFVHMLVQWDIKYQGDSMGEKIRQSLDCIRREAVALGQTMREPSLRLESDLQSLYFQQMERYICADGWVECLLYLDEQIRDEQIRDQQMRNEERQDPLVSLAADKECCAPSEQDLQSKRRRCQAQKAMEVGAFLLDLFPMPTETPPRNTQEGCKKPAQLSPSCVDGSSGHREK